MHVGPYESPFFPAAYHITFSWLVLFGGGEIKTITIFFLYKRFENTIYIYLYI